MITGIKNWIHRQLELLRFNQCLVKDNIELNKLLNFKIERLLQNIEVLDQDKIYFIKIEHPDDANYFIEIYNRLKIKLKWTAPNILLLEAELEELSEDKLQSLLRECRTNKIKG